MKKIVTLLVKRCLPLFLFTMAQIKAWASDTTTAGTLDKSDSIFSQPWIWIGIAVAVTIKLLGPFTEDAKDIVVIRKKSVKKIFDRD